MLNQAAHNVIGGGAYQIENSLLFEAATTSKLSRTPSTTTENKKGTLSVWCKRTAITDGALLRAGGSGAQFYDALIIIANALTYYNWDGALTDWVEPSDEIWDASSFVHLVIAIDTTQAVESERVRIYIDNRRLIDFTTANYPTLNQTTRFNTTELHVIGDENTVTTRKLNAYIAEYIWIAGEQLSPYSFGEWHPQNPRVWRPIDPSGLDFSADANSFWLNFADGTSATTLGYDVSGNGNHFTPSGITTANQSTDTPTRNCAVWDCSYRFGNCSNGSRTVTRSSIDRTYFATLPIYPDSGVWYVEIKCDALSASVWNSVGVALLNAHDDNAATNNKYTYRYSGNKHINGTVTAYGATWGAGDVISIILDSDNKTIEFWKNGVSQGVAFTGVVEDVYRIMCGDDTSTDTFTIRSNPDEFSYTPPAGAKPLISQSYSLPVIPDTGDVFDVVQWTGTVPNPQTINVTNASPNAVWFHDISFAWRPGLKFKGNNTGFMRIDNPEVEIVDSQCITNWYADSFRVGASNYSNYAGEVFKGMSFSKIANFMWCKEFTGTGANHTEWHGLGVWPTFVLVSNLNTAEANVAWTRYLDPVDALQLDSNAAKFTAADNFNSTWPTPTTVTVGTASRTNNSGSRIQLMVMGDVPGVTKAVAWTGDGNVNGPIINCGFKPRWLIFKNTAAAHSWFMFDSYTNTISEWGQALRPDTNAVLATFAAHISVTSVGFKIRTTLADMNAAGNLFTGFAIADIPTSMINNGAL